MKIKTPSNLKAAVLAANPDSHFFDRETMRSFGDTMRNYAIEQPMTITTHRGDCLAYELRRKRPVKDGRQQSAWFDAVTFRQVFPV